MMETAKSSLRRLLSTLSEHMFPTTSFCRDISRHVYELPSLGCIL